MEDFVYSHYTLPEGVTVETVEGGNKYKGRVWQELARQIFCEHGPEGSYREIEHFESGAPFIYGSGNRISISHTPGCFVAASMPLPESADPAFFTPLAAPGIDVERKDRSKVKDLRERFLNSAELSLVNPDSVEANVLAWTCKEAMLKAYMNPTVNWRDNIVIEKLPEKGNPGKGRLTFGNETVEFRLFLLPSDEFQITLALPV